jgi:hypothetical protein
VLGGPWAGQPEDSTAAIAASIRRASSTSMSVTRSREWRPDLEGDRVPQLLDARVVGHVAFGAGDGVA